MNENLETCKLGALPVLSAIIDKLNIEEIINHSVTYDPEQCKLTPGTLAKSLILTIPVSRTALYRVDEFYENIDLKPIFGDGVTASDFNDDALGRMLDKLHSAGLKKIYSTIALFAYTQLNLDGSFLHFDTTSKSLYGLYEGDLRGNLEISKGHSKDHRPDLKPIMFGVGITKSGIPIYGEVLNGNTSDKTWNCDVLKHLESELSNADISQIRYVADSACVTEKNLEIIDENGILVISRLPDTFNINDELKDRSLESNNWNAIGEFKENGAKYRTKSFPETLYGRKYRFIVCHSDHLEDRKRKSIEKNIKKEQKRLEKELKRYTKPDYYCRYDAKKALERVWSTKSEYHSLTGDIREKQVVKRKRGRPRKNEVLPTETRNPDKIKNAIQKASMFILITNISDSECSDEEILKEYKEQSGIERLFRVLKDPFFIDQFRIEAFGYMSVLEYIIRRSLDDENEKPIQIPGKRKSKRPTARAILDVLDPITVIKTNGKTIKISINSNQLRIIVYTKLR